MAPAVRGPVKEDVPFIMDSWLRSLRQTYRQLPDDLFFDTYRELIKRVLKTSSVRILADGNRILGYCVSWDKEGIVHTCYQRKPNEEHLKLLMQNLPTKPDYTFRTRQSLAALGRLQEGLLRRLSPPSPSGLSSKSPSPSATT